MLKSNWDKVYDIYSLRIHRPLWDRIHSVGEERVKRDVNRFNMKDNEFDYVISNDDNKKEDLYRKLEEFMSIMRLRERSKEYSTLIP